MKKTYIDVNQVFTDKNASPSMVMRAKILVQPHERLERTHLTNAEATRAFGIQANAVRYIRELNVNNLSLDYLVDLADILGVTAEIQVGPGPRITYRRSKGDTLRYLGD